MGLINQVLTDMDNPNNLKYIFCPRTVAIIGASTRENSVGRYVFTNVLFSGYTGIVYPVNPKAHGILGVRAYHSVWDIPGEVDLAVIVVPSEVVPTVMEECGEKGVKGAVIISAGFKEIGKKGAELESVIKAIAIKYRISLVGPNCLGIINTDPEVSLNATFARGMPHRGNIACISQSGAVGVAILELTKERNIGLSKFISLGNKSDISENDVLFALKEDKYTDVILLYLEDLANPKCFIELSREITEHKPILVIKSGRTLEGAKAASSHTGALSSSDEAYDSLFKQCGILRVETLEELLDYGTAFAKQPLPTSNRIAIITNAGGHGIMATDACIRHNLKLAEFSPTTTSSLQAGLPPTANISNPVDVIGDANKERYELALNTVLSDPNVNGAIVIYVSSAILNSDEIIRTISEICPRYKKPILACCTGVEDMSETLRLLDKSNIPNYRFPESAVRALAHMAEYSEWSSHPHTTIREFKGVNKDRVKELISFASKCGRTFLPEPESYEALKAYGFPLLKSNLAKNESQCVSYAREIGYPVVLKIVSPDILHKVDVGGVKLNICNENELRSSYLELLNSVKSALPGADIWGVFVQEFVRGGKEIIIGMNRDPHFGALLMFGLGGIYVEVLKDVSFRVAPIRELSALHMIEEIRGYKILAGYRGAEPSDIESIVECLERLSQLVTDFEEISEIDINPLLVFERGKGCKVIDARILIGH